MIPMQQVRKFFCGVTSCARKIFVERGKMNKLKLIKRMGHGRAGFPLLRQWVLHVL